MKGEKSNGAVSEIVGTMLLLMIVISVFSLIYYQVLSDEGPENKTIVKISGRIEGTNVVLEHQGGEPLELDTEISITVGGIEYKGPVGNWLDDKNDDGVWNIGERTLFSFEYNLSCLGDFQEVDILAIDTQGNSVIFAGPIDLEPVSDVGIEVWVDNLYPKLGDHINITIIVTCYGGDVDGAGNVEIKYLVPEGFIYFDNNLTQGTYDNETGIWDVENVLVGQPATIRIEVKVVGIEEFDFTQIAMILDGSDSISGTNWNLMKEGLKQAILNESVFPHDGSVELTVVQFGGGSWFSNSYAQVELSPTIITDNASDPGYYIDVSEDIRNINQLRGMTPTGCGIRLGADQLHDNGNFSSDQQQIIVLVTDGEANCEWIPGGYTAQYAGGTSGKISAETAREYLLTTLDMQEDQDEFDSLAVGSGPDIPWLNSSIVWPQPGYIAPPYTSGSGWVNHVTDWQEFAEAITELFNYIFMSRTMSVELAGSTTLDPNIQNDHVIINIIPDM
jgi:uncharacterized protein YegL